MNPLIALAIFLAGFGAAWSWQGARGDARVLDVELAETDKRLADARLWHAEVLRRQQLADDITRAASQREATLDRQLQEAHHALKTATLGRPCLGGAALRLLDQSPGLHPGPAAAPAGPPDRGSAGPAPDPALEEEASDTDVAGWIATAGRYYERCRGRLADIRRYEAAP